MATINDILSQVLNLNTKYFVDMGASDSQSESQTEILLNYGWNGLMLEGNTANYNGLSQRMKSFNHMVKVLNCKITPDNILDVLRENNTPDEFYMSLDIDGYDYYILEKVLSKYKPQLIISEINEKIPPPIKFSVSYREDFWWKVDDFYGYSLSMLENLLNIYNYKIDSLQYNNVILVPGKQEVDFLDIYNEGYFNKPGRTTKFFYNKKYDELYTLPENKRIEYIIDKFDFDKYKGQYIIE